MTSIAVFDERYRIQNEEKNNSGVLYLKDGILYKLYKDNSFIEEKERNVLFFKENYLFEPEIIDLIYDNNNFIGYSQKYLSNCKTFKDGINDKNLDYNFKVKIISDIFEKIKLLHQNNILIGDVHSKNFIYNDEAGYIVDLDEVRFKGIDDFKFEELYLIKQDERKPYIKVASEYTDNVKATISALSLLYNYDFEDLIQNKTILLPDIKDKLIEIIGDFELCNEIFNLFNSKENVIYFDDILARKKHTK